MERTVRILYTEGDGMFHETEWNKPDIEANEIEVKAVMTGVCRSDIDMMHGTFKLPLYMQGHEGLGLVTKVGKDVIDVNIGDYVATRGEPAFADYYNVKSNEYVVVPEANPKYIVEPIACALNILNRFDRPIKGRIALAGTGFLASIIYQQIKGMDCDVDVIGTHNVKFWNNQGVLLKPNPFGKYDVIIDLSNKDWTITGDYLNANGLLMLSASKHPTVSTDFNQWLWNNLTVICPSPRDNNFINCMKWAVDLIKNGSLNLDLVWTKGYNRDTEWQQAFSDADTRVPGYNRGYIYWS